MEESSDVYLCLNCKKPITGKREKFHKGCKREYLKQTHECACGCGEIIPRFTNNLEPQRYKHGHHVRVENPYFWGGVNNWNWNGGRRYREERGRRYILMWKPEHHFADHQGYVLEHRLVWEREYNAILLPWSNVHHRDNDSLNNVWYNLRAMMATEHSRFHRNEEWKNGISNFRR